MSSGRIVSASSPRAKRAASLPPEVASPTSSTARAIGTPFQSSTTASGDEARDAAQVAAVDLGDDEAPARALDEERQEGGGPAVALGQHVAGVEVAQAPEDLQHRLVEAPFAAGPGGRVGEDPPRLVVELVGQGAQGAVDVVGLRGRLEGPVDVDVGEQRARLLDDQDLLGRPDAVVGQRRLLAVEEVGERLHLADVVIDRGHRRRGSRVDASHVKAVAAYARPMPGEPLAERRVSSGAIVGREAERRALAAAIEGAAAGRPAVVLVGGEAGAGKTRLVDDVVARAAEQGALALSGSSVELTAGELPYGPLVAALRDLPLDPAHPRADDIRTVRRELGDRLTGSAAAPVDPGQGQTHVFEGLLGAFKRLGRRGTVVVVLEDVHWADASSLDFLRFLVRNVAEEPLVLVATYRSDEVDRGHPLRLLLADLLRAPVVQQLALGPLSPDDVAQQATAILGAPPPPALLAELVDRADGNPFFVEELLAGGPAACRPISTTRCCCASRRSTSPARRWPARRRWPAGRSTRRSSATSPGSTPGPRRRRCAPPPAARC